MGFLLAETISGDTSVSLALILAILGLAGGGAIASIVSRVTHGEAIKQLRKDVDAQAHRDSAHESRISELETWRIRTEAHADAIKEHSSTARGTKPYPRGA